MSSNSWLEMTSHLQRSWLGEDPILVQRLKETDGSLEETEQVLSTYAAENAGRYLGRQQYYHQGRDHFRQRGSQWHTGPGWLLLP